MSCNSSKIPIIANSPSLPNIDDNANFDIDFSNFVVDRDNAFKFNANNDEESMDTNFITVNSKRKLRNANVNSNSNSDEPGLKTASSRSFQLPTKYKFSSLN